MTETASYSPTAEHRHRTRGIEEQFCELVCADDELLRAEFDAIITAAWPDAPTDPPDPPTDSAGADGDPVEEPTPGGRPPRPVPTTGRSRRAAHTSTPIRGRSPPPRD